MRSVVTDDLVPLCERLLAGDEAELPMLPTIAQETLALCQDEHVDAARLSEVLHRDQGLAGHVLRVANSPLYRPGVPIGSLQQAISRLGFRALSELAVAVAVRGKVFASEGASSLAEHMAGLWRHAAAVGLFAQEIARQRRRNVESAFLCGLLHDVGRPVILAAAAKEHPDAGLPVLVSAMDNYHNVVGLRLAELWQLPPQVVASARWHHDWSQADGHVEAVMTVALADRLAHWAVPSGDDAVTEDELRQLPVLEGLNLYPDEMEALLERREDVCEKVEVIS
ncbi:MAG: HDOD domain-containing protein [Planctomycetota bacterium]